MTVDSEDEEGTTDVTITNGEITEDDLELDVEEIKQLVVAPTDWTISVLVSLLKRGKINLEPNYQRRVAWDERKMSRFIESLFMRLPVPQIVLAEMKPGTFAVIDGKQRMNSLARFCLDESQPLRLSACEYRVDLNGKTYEEAQGIGALEQSIDAFENHTVRTVVLKNWKSNSLLYLLFLRLNQNSVTLSSQELRRALFPGDFMKWLDDKTTGSPGMTFLFNKTPDFRMRDMELGTRFLAFRTSAGSYNGNMKKFLDGSSRELTANFKQRWQELEDHWCDFEAAMALTKEIFGDDAFKSRNRGRYQRSFNRAVLDIMTYYLANSSLREIVERNSLEPIKKAFERICDESPAFLQAIQSSTKTVRATSQRFHDWGDELRELFGSTVPEFPLSRNK